MSLRNPKVSVQGTPLIIQDQFDIIQNRHSIDLDPLFHKKENGRALGGTVF